MLVMNGRRGYGSDAVNLDTAAMLGPRISDNDAVLIVGAGVVADDRILDAVLAAAADLPDNGPPVIATWSTACGRRGVERIDAVAFASGVALYPGAMVRRVALQLGDWDLPSTLLRAALCEPGCVRLDLTSILSTVTGVQPTPLTYAVVTTPDAASAASEVVLAATAQPRLDAVSRYLLQPVEHTILQVIAPSRITPHAIVAVIGVTGIAATLAFAGGWLWAGMTLALLFGLLQHTGKRLAGARVIRLRWHRWALFSAAAGCNWWLALAVALTLARGNGGPLAVAALLILVQITAASEVSALERLGGDYAKFTDSIDRRITLLTANRDSLLLLLVPFALAGRWYAGLIALAAYGVASFAAIHARFLQRLTRHRQV